MPVFVCGGGVLLSGATAQLVLLAEALGAPVATTVSGIGTISHAHPLAVGVVGTNGGTPETRELLAAADVVIFVGCRAGSTSTEHWTVPAAGAVRIVHIDIDPMVVGANYKADAGLVGDALLAIGALAEEIERRSAGGAGRRNGHAVDLPGLRARKRAAFDALAASDERPIRPERVLAALQRALPEEAVVIADPGTPCPYVSGHFAFGEGRRFITNRAQGALGFALSAAIGAWYGRPEAKCVAVMGDGSFAFTVGELETVVRKKIPLTIIVFSNSSFGWIKASQKEGYEARYFSVDFSRSDHARIAEAYGVKSWRVEDPAQLDTVMQAAMRHQGPTLIDVIAQPLEESRVPVSKWMG
jgi:acetolactate synthase-1/2/3 large subunit